MTHGVTTLERPFHWLKGAARHRVVWLGLPIVLYLWTISGPFLFDDLTLLHAVDRYDAGETDNPSLFRFATDDAEWQAFLDRGTLPWWSAARPVDFFRPLAEWAFYLDVKLFGRSPLPHRIASLAWFAIVLLCLRRLFAIFTKDMATANVATLLFGVSQTVTQPVTFICNRSDLFVIVATSLAAWAYLRAGRGSGHASNETSKSKAVLVLLAVAGFAIALLSKEVAVAFAGVVCAHTLITRLWKAGPRPTRTQGLIALACFAMAIAYLGYYYTTRIAPGLGKGGGLAALPDLAAFFRILGTYLAVWMFGFPINVLPQLPGEYTLAIAIAAGLIALVVLRCIFRTVRRKAGERDSGKPAGGLFFFTLWAGMFMLPPLLSVPEPRALCVASVGWAFLLATLLTPKDGPETPPAAPLALRHWLLTANLSISLICAVCTVLISNHLEKQARSAMLNRVGALDPPLADGQTLLFVEAQSPAELLCAADRLEHITGCRNLSVYYFTVPGAAEAGTVVDRLDDRTLRLSSPSSLLYDSPMHRLARDHAAPPKLGDTIDVPAFTAEITDLRADRTVEAITLHLHRPLSDSSVRLIRPAGDSRNTTRHPEAMP